MKPGFFFLCGKTDAFKFYFNIAFDYIYLIGTCTVYRKRNKLCDVVGLVKIVIKGNGFRLDDPTFFHQISKFSTLDRVYIKCYVNLLFGFIQRFEKPYFQTRISNYLKDGCYV